MKKIIAVLIAGTFIIGTAVAQTPAPTTKPAEKKEVTAAPQKKDNMEVKNADGSKKHHKGGHHKGKKADTATPAQK